eukprot:Skav218566  [mRNA]  locus=scaffold2610:84830:86170:+ [translate_table: standard]
MVADVPSETISFLHDAPPCTQEHFWPVESIEEIAFRQQLSSLPVDPSPSAFVPCDTVMHLFTDGSCKAPKIPHLRVALWGFCQADLHTETFNPIASGLVKGPCHTTLRGEITAAIEAIKYGIRCDKPFYVWTDNQTLYNRLKCIMFDQVFHITVKRKDHDLWQTLADVTKIALRRHLFQHVVKVASHQDTARLHCPIVRWSAAGNEAADKVAEAAWLALSPQLRALWHTAYDKYMHRLQSVRRLWKHVVQIGKFHIGSKPQFHDQASEAWQSHLGRLNPVEAQPSLMPFPDSRPETTWAIRDCETTLWAWLQAFSGRSGGEPVWLSSYQLLVHFQATTGQVGFRYENSKNRWFPIESSEDDFDFNRTAAWLIALVKKFAHVHQLSCVVQSQVPVGHTFRMWCRCILLKVPLDVVRKIQGRFDDIGIKHASSVGPLKYLPADLTPFP